MENCIFCKIINKEIPSFKVYEDEQVYAFLTITPSTKGHTLMIPKTHNEDIYDLSEEAAANLFKAVPKVANAIKKAFNPIGLNIVNNNRRPHQEVFHYHIQLIPRYEDDEFEIRFNNMNTPMEELKAIGEEIANNI